MLAVALIGLGRQRASRRESSRAAGDNLNVQAALRHVFADLAGSVGVAIAALVVLTTGWQRADPVAGMAIGVLILGSSWSILRDSVVDPARGDPDRDRRGRGRAAHGVGRGRRRGARPAHLDDHVRIPDALGSRPRAAGRRLPRCAADELERLLAEEFDLEHTTLQVEHVGERSGLRIEPLRRRVR